MNGKHIILGVTGGIAVYKSADLCSKLVSAGFDVRVVMTANALRLISDRIFLTLSKHPVLTDLFSGIQPRPEHVDLAEWADLLVVAPATANFIGKYASGPDTGRLACGTSGKGRMAEPADILEAVRKSFPA